MGHIRLALIDKVPQAKSIFTSRVNIKLTKRMTRYNTPGFLFTAPVSPPPTNDEETGASDGVTNILGVLLEPLARPASIVAKSSVAAFPSRTGNLASTTNVGHKGASEE